jgi:hypothetical protein
MLKAAEQALRELRRPEDVARARGKVVSDVLPFAVPSAEAEAEEPAPVAVAVAAPAEEAAAAEEAPAAEEATDGEN